MFDPMVTCFCDQYLVIYYWLIDISRVYKLMLFDLATKECKKVELPEGTRVAMKEQENGDDEDKEDFVFGDSETE